MQLDADTSPRAPERGVRPRSPATCAVLGAVTGGLFCFYWFFVTARELNEEGASVPSGWWMFVPVVNLWWFWRWCEGVGVYTRDYLSAATALVYLLVVPVVEGFGVLGTDLSFGWMLAVFALLGLLSVACISVPILQSTLNRFRRVHLAETFD